jgi:hypothetical protein
MIKPEVVDKVLGARTYENYQHVLDAFIEEQARAYTNDQRYSFAWAAGLKTQLQADLAFAERVNDDYIAFLEGVSSRGTANFTEGEKILSVFVLAISVLLLVNDALDFMFALGIAALLTALAAASLENEARELQALLRKLLQELEKAKREVNEAWAQVALDGIVVVALACAGPLGWLTLGAVGLGQMIADTYLGPSTSDAATWGNRGNTTLGTALSASEKYLQESSKALKVVKPAGRVVIVVGFVFDANEILVGYRNIDGVKRLIADLKKAQDKLTAKIKLQKGTFSALALKIVDLRKEVEKRGKGYTAQTRETLEDEMRRSGYRPAV